MVSKDYYKILDLETSKVSIEELKIAYRQAVKKNHPDVNIKDELAEEKIKDINEAYKVLSSPSDKRKYDRMWNLYNKKQETRSYDVKDEESSILKIFFGNIKEDIHKKFNKTENPIKGENIETRIKISIHEGMKGLEKKIEIKDIVNKNKTLNVTIPKGILDGEKIRLIGQGKPGKNGGKNGDLYITVNIENDKNLKIVKYDLYKEVLITPEEAVLGTKTDINVLDELISLTIPKGTNSGEKIIIEEKGYLKNILGKKQKEKILRGNLILNIKIIISKNLTKEEEKLYEKLKKISKYNPRNI